jgi:uncharacterized Zn finger protein
MGWYGYGFWRPYVPVSQRRAQAAQKMAQLRKKGVDIQPVTIAGRKIAHTFWGEAWCDHLEKFSDYANRLPRGRTYVRNGSVCHLVIQKGKIEAKVSGSELYTVKIEINTLPAARWASIKGACAGQVGSLLELLQGKLSNRVMSIVTDRDQGMFPSPQEIKLSCSCPDWAVMCKHVAAVLYGVGTRLDTKPELLFLLRGVDHQELVSKEAAREVVSRGSRAKGRSLDEAQVGEVFGIDLTQSEPAPAPRTSTRRKTQGKTVIVTTEPLPARGRRAPALKKLAKPEQKLAKPEQKKDSSPSTPGKRKRVKQQ